MALKTVVAFAQIADGFNPGANANVYAIALQSDGKLVIGGDFTTVGGGGTGSTARQRLARLNIDGSVDTTFNPGVAGDVRALTIQNDGKILVGGTFTGLGGGTGTTPRTNVGRLNPDGTVDATFNPGANSTVFAIALELDGDILLGGNFTGVGGGSGTSTRHRIARLSTAGVVDATFNPGAGASVFAIALQTDGRILVGGQFTGLGGGTGTTTRNRIGRLNADGTVDPTFDPGSSGAVNALALETDDQIVVAGFFTGLGGGTGTTARNSIGRLNPDGSLDAFNPGVSTGGTVASLAVQADGRIIAVGAFVGLGGGTGSTPRSNIGRLNADGTIDASFDPGANGAVNALLLQADGQLILAGSFTAVGGGGTGTAARARLARVLNNVQASETLFKTGTTVFWMRSGSAPEIRAAEVATSTDGVSFATLGPLSRIAGGWQRSGVVLADNPNLRVRARGRVAGGQFGGSESVIDTHAPAPHTNIIENDSFGSSLTPWQTFDQPTGTGMTWSIVGGVLHFNRVGTQAALIQSTGMPVPADAPLELSIQLGNTDSVRKRVSVLLHDSSFADLFVCTFWLPPATTLRTYTMRTHTTQAWTNATLSIYAATAGTGGSYQVDNVSLELAPDNSVTETTCRDPSAPAPPGGAASANLIVNGTFTSVLTPWTTSGQIVGSVTAGEYRFARIAGSPAGVVLQSTAQAASAGQIVEASFDLGNMAIVRSRVTVLLHDASFGDLAACTFWLEPSQSPSPYRMRAYASVAWTSATLSVYPTTLNNTIRLDNVTLRRVNSQANLGTECLEAGSLLDQ